MGDRPKIDEQYRTSLGHGNQRDVVGAYGLADRRLTDGWVPTGPDDGYRIPKAPLSVSLERFFAGDKHAVHALVEEMARMVWSRADRFNIHPKLSRPAAHDMACAVLAWHRGGTCRACGGHGFELIPGTPAKSERHCKVCYDRERGVSDGKIPFEPQFRMEYRGLARWLLVEVEEAASRAAPEAMKALYERMHF
jgi:hypothetical protein